MSGKPLAGLHSVTLAELLDFSLPSFQLSATLLTVRPCVGRVQAESPVHPGSSSASFIPHYVASNKPLVLCEPQFCIYLPGLCCFLNTAIMPVLGLQQRLRTFLASTLGRHGSSCWCCPHRSALRHRAGCRETCRDKWEACSLPPPAGRGAPAHADPLRY